MSVNGPWSLVLKRLPGNRPDAYGEAEFLLEHREPWLLRAVTMQRRENESGTDAADWETFWASLTFRLRR